MPRSSDQPPPRHLARHAWLFHAAAGAALAAGCSRGVDGVEVRGRVTRGDKPVASGSIVFEPLEGRSRTAGGVITAGEYALVGRSRVPAGEHRVHVLAIEATGRKVESGPPDPPGTFVEETASVRESFSATVPPGPPATLDFKLAP